MKNAYLTFQVNARPKLDSLDEEELPAFVLVWLDSEPALWVLHCMVHCIVLYMVLIIIIVKFG